MTLAIDDTVALARATRSVARAMSRSGQQSDAVTALIGMTDRIRPELAGREHELLSPLGMLFLAASITAATQDDAALALAMHEQAAEAADRLQPQSPLPTSRSRTVAVAARHDQRGSSRTLRQMAARAGVTA